MPKQPWIGKPVTEIVFILMPPFLSLLFIALFPQLFRNNKDMPDAVWVLLILLIDVAHVYSTLYRTYFDPQAFIKYRSVLWTIPFAGFVTGVIIYSISSMLFWRLLAYVAVFHFIRQQYGFMRVYGRFEKQNKLLEAIDTLTIYYATLYPILYWHLKGPRNFSWFIEGDFVFMKADWLLMVATSLYIIIAAAYIIKEVFLLIKNKAFNIPKFAIISGTLLSWYFGIVYFNGDMAFTLLNVVSHGIPYMALIWIYGQNNYVKKGSGTGFLKLLFSRYGVMIFLGLLFLLAFIEEGLWDIVLWEEHRNVFRTGSINLQLNDQLLSFIVPLLALPQSHITFSMASSGKSKRTSSNEQIITPGCRTATWAASAVARITRPYNTQT